LVSLFAGRRFLFPNPLIDFRAGGDTVRQHAPVHDRNGSLCRRASQKNDFRDAEASAEAVQRPTMKFVATKTADQLDLQALTRHSPPLRNRIVQTIFMEGGSMTGIGPLP
jgi:transposase